MSWMEDLRGGAAYLSSARRRMEPEVLDLTDEQRERFVSAMNASVELAGEAIDILIAAGVWPYYRDGGMTRGTEKTPESTKLRPGSPPRRTVITGSSQPVKPTPAPKKRSDFDAAHPWRKET